MVTITKSDAIAKAIGKDQLMARALKAARGIKISSVAYATEESASEERTASAFHFGMRSWIAI
jgi:hypothetical protein